MVYESVIDRVDALASELGESEALDAKRVVTIARDLRQAAASDPSLRQELNRLGETLARRSARALPAAALARAALADLWGDERERDRALAECNAKLELFGA
jgi:predicted nucleic acid-binding Zn ribbon protein